jgi:hypothetical protein
MNWQLGIALYAAGISTLVLIWRLIEYYLEKSGRIKVVASIMPRYKLWADPAFDDPTQKLIINVTNFSKHNRLIEAPKIVTDIKIKEENIFTLANFDTCDNFPMTLEPGGRQLFLYGKDEYYHWYKNNGVKRIQIGSVQLSVSFLFSIVSLVFPCGEMPGGRRPEGKPPQGMVYIL